MSISAIEEPQKKKRKFRIMPSKTWFKKVLHSKVFWTCLILYIVVSIFLHWLVAGYQPPFPPRWIGVKYYLINNIPSENKNELPKVPTSLNSIQSALIVLKPNTPEAIELLPSEIILNAFSLTDQKAIDVTLATLLAQHLSGIDSSKKESATKILADIENAVSLDKILIAVTQSNNIPEADRLLNIKDKATEVDPSKFDEVQEKLMLAPTIDPLTEEEIKKINKPLLTIEKKGIYRIYKNKEEIFKNPVPAYEANYSDFLNINNKLIPIRSGVSPILVFNPGKYLIEDGSTVTPISYYLALHTVNGLPFTLKGIGHGWVSLSRKEDEYFFPIMTMSLFNSLDTDNKQNIEKAEITNIATYTNLWINHPDDWLRAVRSLNRIPLPDGESRYRLAELTPEQAKSIIYLREWYMPRYSTQEIYMSYLVETLKKTNNPKDALTVILEIGHIKIQNLMNKTFWGIIQIAMNGTTGDTRYNGITSNCVAYSTDFWNKIIIDPAYNPRILGLIPDPGKLYHLMRTAEIIDLPDANTLPEDQRDTQYMR